MELALVLVLGIEAGVGVRANEIAACGGVLEQGDLIYVLCWMARIRAAAMPLTVGGWCRSPRATIRLIEMGTVAINGSPRRR